MKLLQTLQQVSQPEICVLFAFFSLVIFFMPFESSGQVGINRTNLSTPSVLLEFSGDHPGGIVLPWVNSADVVSPVPGTLIYDVSDMHIKLYRGVDVGGWWDLSGSNSGGDFSKEVDIQSLVVEGPGSKTIVGARSSTADGVWVLESPDKAMVLPIVSNPETTIVKPVPGIIVYDSDRNLLCTFNGTVWSFWSY